MSDLKEILNQKKNPAIILLRYLVEINSIQGKITFIYKHICMDILNLSKKNQGIKIKIC